MASLTAPLLYPWLPSQLAVSGQPRIQGNGTGRQEGLAVRWAR